MIFMSAGCREAFFAGNKFLNYRVSSSASKSSLDILILKCNKNSVLGIAVL